MMSVNYYSRSATIIISVSWSLLGPADEPSFSLRLAVAEANIYTLAKVGVSAVVFASCVDIVRPRCPTS